MKRWKNIIDNYKKTERKKDKSGQGALSGRRYLYARQLSFLQQIIEAVPTENSIVEEEENENDNNDDSISPHKNSSDQATSETPTDDPSDNLEKIPAVKRRKIIEKTLIKFMNKAPTPTVEVPDDDKSFFDSIIPAVKSLSLDHKLEFRCEIMKLISRYRLLKRTGAYQNHPPFSAAPTSCSSISHLSGTGYGSNPSGSPSGPSYTTLSPYGSSSVNSNYRDSMDIFGSDYSTN
ncbi:hypothetical protein J6590_003948 [Homalodisca vitripennis]|nr:hypothetical protein J6590_003948 [Homalodisca vitripennis]